MPCFVSTRLPFLKIKHGQAIQTKDLGSRANASFIPWIQNRWKMSSSPFLWKEITHFKPSWSLLECISPTRKEPAYSQTNPDTPYIIMSGSTLQLNGNELTQCNGRIMHKWLERNINICSYNQPQKQFTCQSNWWKMLHLQKCLQVLSQVGRRPSTQNPKPSPPTRPLATPNNII